MQTPGNSGIAGSLTVTAFLRLRRREVRQLFLYYQETPCRGVLCASEQYNSGAAKHLGCTRSPQFNQQRTLANRRGFFVCLAARRGRRPVAPRGGAANTYSQAAAPAGCVGAGRSTPALCPKCDQYAPWLLSRCVGAARAARLQPWQRAGALKGARGVCGAARRNSQRGRRFYQLPRLRPRGGRGFSPAPQRRAPPLPLLLSSDKRSE